MSPILLGAGRNVRRGGGRAVLFDGSVGPWNEVDTGGKLDISGGVVTITADAGNAYGDPEIVSDSLERVAGYVLDFDLTLDQIGQGIALGLWAVSSGINPGTAGDLAHVIWFHTTQAYCRESGAEGAVLGYAATTYYCRILLKATGATYFIDTVEANRGTTEEADLAENATDPFYVGLTSLGNNGFTISNIIYGEAN